MNGQRIPRTPIVVDYWNLGKVPPRCLFFLTHMHADHTSGLNASWPCPIHCTAVTGKLLIRKFKVDPKLVVELEVGESRMLHVDRCGSHVTITVTTIDANHCPGSAMFLFEGYFGRILYTGDFRFSPSMLDNPLLNSSRSIDILYLDNTYCDPSCNFPTREEATGSLISLIREKSEQCKTVVIGLHTLGKEELLVQLATSLRQWVGVSSERMATLKLLELPDVFTTDMIGSFFQVHPFYLVAKNRLAEMSSEDVLAVLPTCLYSGRGALPQPPGVVVVAYSDHSSFEELKRFVKVIRPHSVKPIVKSFSGDRSCISAVRGDMSVFDEYLDPSQPPEYRMPTGAEDLAANNSQISYLSPLSGPIPTPITIRRSHSYSSGSSSTKAVQLRNRSMGVRFVSPIKSKSPEESLEISDSSDQNDSQLKISNHTTQDSNSGSGVVTCRSGASSKIVQFVDLTNSADDEHQSVPPGRLENSLQSLSSGKLPLDLPPLLEVEPAMSSSFLSLTQHQNGDSKSSAVSTTEPTFVQTKLNVFTKPVDNSNAAATVRSKYFTESTRLTAISLSLEESVTCARVVPLELLKLGRNKKTGSGDEPVIMESEAYQKATDSEDTEEKGETSYESKLAESSENHQENVTRAHSHECESIEESIDESRGEYCDDDSDSDTSPDSPTSCARLMPVDAVKLKRSGQDDQIAKESDTIPSTSPSPIARVESLESEDLNVAEARATNTEVIDLTHSVDSQSPSPKSPTFIPTVSTPQSGNFQNLSDFLHQSTEQSTAAFAEGSSDHRKGQGSSVRNADSAENILPSLPKLGSPKMTDALYGREPSQRVIQDGKDGSGVKRKLLLPSLTFLNDPFNTPSSSQTSSSAGNNCSLSSFLQAPSSKRLKLSMGKVGDEGEAQTTTSSTTATPAVASCKSKRVLPAFLRPSSRLSTSEPGNNFSISYDNHGRDRYSRGLVDAGVAGNGACVCGYSETLRVPMCRQCRSTVIGLNRSGLFGRLSKLDLSSPEISQVIHDAIDRATCHQQSICQKTLPLPRTCEDHEHTNEHVDISNCRSRTSKIDTNFDKSATN